MTDAGVPAILLLPLAAWLGWWLASRTGRSRQREQLSSNYFRGLNYLLNEQPDKAIEVFVKLAEVNRDTVETHLALGSLFRRRGEMDKAIQFHRHIMTRNQLSDRHRMQALVELGEDYMRAGLLDRAEKLFEQLAESPEHGAAAMRQLLDIYQQEKDWHKAIEVAERLQRADGSDRGAQIAQFHCELATLSWDGSDRPSARNHLERARAAHSECVRARLLAARFDEADGRYDQAVANYRAACELDPDLVTLVATELAQACRRLDRTEDLLAWLDTLLDRASTLAPAVVYSNVLADRDPEAAIGYLVRQLRSRPTARGVRQLLHLMHAHDHRDPEIDPNLLLELMQRLLSDQPRFRCRQCGFSGQIWHWQCPSCRLWETTRPVGGALGE